MCITTVYADDNGQKEMVMQDVIYIEFDNNDILLTTILGERKSLAAKITYIDFLEHSVTVNSNQL